MNFVAVARRGAGLVRAVSDDELLAVARAAFGERAQVRTRRLLGDGHFNTSYLLLCANERPVVLRLAPAPAARLWRHERALLQRQCSVQSVLEGVGPVVPRLLHSDFTQRVVARDWALFEWRPGQPWESVADRIDAAHAEALWRDFGRIVRAVHALPGRRYGYPDPMPPPTSYGAWFAGVVDDLAADLAEQGIEVAGLADYRARLRDERRRFEAVGAPRLVHGDLWRRNVLVDRTPEGWRITALLDAERAFFGDPAAEWIFGFLDLPRSFWHGYGRSLEEQRLDPDALWRRRAYQARGALHMLLEGARFGFDAAFAHVQFARFLAELQSLHARPRHFESMAIAHPPTH